LAYFAAYNKLFSKRAFRPTSASAPFCSHYRQINLNADNSTHATATPAATQHATKHQNETCFPVSGGIRIYIAKAAINTMPAMKTRKHRSFTVISTPIPFPADNGAFFASRFVSGVFYFAKIEFGPNFGPLLPHAILRA
jgi:hypothetical protein